MKYLPLKRLHYSNDYLKLLMLILTSSEMSMTLNNLCLFKKNTNTNVNGPF